MDPCVYIDGVVFENNSQIGIWRMFYNLIERLKDSVDICVALESKQIQDIPKGVKVIKGFLGRQSPINKWQEFKQFYKILFFSKNKKFNIYHSTYFTIPSLSGSLKIIQTYYDSISEEMFYLHNGNLNAHQKCRALKSSDCVMTISESSLRSLVEHYPDYMGIKKRIYCGSNHVNYRGGIINSIQRNNSFLYVGARNGYKNFKIILDTIEQKKWPLNYKLKVIGKNMSELERNYLRAKKISDFVVELGQLDDNQLVAEYLSSSGMILPSLNEGFGLNIVEAQAHGCPLICSDIDVFREVAGSGACFFDPYSPMSLGESLKKITIKSYADSLTSLGFINAKKYSWDLAANELRELYISILK